MTVFKITYIFKGRPYTTVNGLLNALAKDCKACEFSMVVNNQIKGYGNDRKTVIALYDVTPPKVGEPMHVTRSL